MGSCELSDAERSETAGPEKGKKRIEVRRTRGWQYRLHSLNGSFCWFLFKSTIGNGGFSSKYSVWEQMINHS